MESGLSASVLAKRPRDLALFLTLEMRSNRRAVSGAQVNFGEQTSGQLESIPEGGYIL